VERFGLSEPFFLYVARLEHPGKNHVRLIEAFGQFKRETNSPWQLVLAGQDWHGAAEIHQAIARSTLAGAIRCLGFVEEADLPALYRSADAFVYPSLFEGFGLPPIEAMACGCPVISSTAGSLGEVVGDSALVVDPASTRDIAEKLILLATKPELRDTLRSEGLARSRCFNWEKTATETMRVYQRALSRNQTGLS
jgi:glycosyltransferase involved in cell wall biosynthesis